jgi:uncharacterized protein (DUF1330 family)
MTTRILGFIRLKDLDAFEIYRSQVGETVEKFGGIISFRGKPSPALWNDLKFSEFDSFVQLDFPDELAAEQWVTSKAYQALLEVRSKAMDLTLIAIK